MYILTINKLVEEFIKDEDGFYPECWTDSTSIKLFKDMSDCKEYLKQIKQSYHAKGKIADGFLTGKRTIKTTAFRKEKITITTKVDEIHIGDDTMEITSSYDVGECPFGD